MQYMFNKNEGIDLLLDRTGVLYQAHHMILKGKSKDSSVTLEMDLEQGTGKIVHIRPTITMHMSEKEPVQSSDEIYRLAKEYAGNSHLRIGLHRSGNSPFFEKLFDYSFSSFDKIGKIGFVYTNNNNFFPSDRERAFESRVLIKKIFDIFDINYNIDDAKKEVEVLKDQKQMHLTHERIKKAYECMYETGYYPSIASGGLFSGFHLFQYPPHRSSAPKATIHLDIKGDPKGNCVPIKHEISQGSLELITMTMERLGFLFPNSNWTFKAETISKIKDSKNEDQLHGRHPEECIHEDHHHGRFAI